jgi:RNA polymerase sigma factor (sigma-70 family)
VFSRQNFFKKFAKSPPILGGAVLRVYERGHQKKSPAFAAAKGGENMNEPNRTQWQIRCAFNGFCKQALKREAMNAHRDTKRQQSREVTFSNLSPLEESQLVTYDRYFADDEAEQSFIIAGKEITAKLLAEALRSLPEEKRETILLYYFFDMSETEISRLCNIPRTTVKYRRNSSFELLKRYLEERAYDCTDW